MCDYPCNYPCCKLFPSYKLYLIDHTRLKTSPPQAASSKFRGQGQARELKGGGDNGELKAAVCVESEAASLSHQ